MDPEMVRDIGLAAAPLLPLIAAAAILRWQRRSR
jgi:hypothetical protein